jgi:hypothetical protein
MIAGRNRAGWWGVAAALALAGTGAAQMFSWPPPAKPTKPARARDAADTAQSAATRARLSEIKIALAWLSDPATFACPLEVHSQRHCMIVIAGTVPSPQLHAQALEMARLNCKLSMIDALTVAPLTTPKPPTGSAVKINVEATNALMEPTFQAIRDLEVQTHPEGKIVVMGTIGSFEDKLRASVRLQQIVGCTAVDNRLEVRPIVVSGQLLQAVTADGQLLTLADAPPVRPPSTAHLPSPPMTHKPAPSRLTVAAPPAATTAVRPRITVLPVSASTPTANDPAITHAVFKTPGIVVRPIRTAPTIVPVAGAQLPATTPLRARVTGVVPIRPPAPSAHAPAATFDANALCDWYRRRIAPECGLEASCVDVHFPTNTDVAVKLHLADRSTAGPACAKVSRIPELAPYRVKISVDAAGRR